MDCIHNNMVSVHHSWFSRIVSPSHPFSHSSVCFCASHLNGQRDRPGFAYSQGFCECKGWCAHLQPRMCVYVHSALYSWCLVYIAQSPISSIWCQPKRRAAITNEDRWQGTEATSCEQCIWEYVCMLCVSTYNTVPYMCLDELHPIITCAKSKKKKLSSCYFLCLFVVIWGWN